MFFSEAAKHLTTPQLASALTSWNQGLSQSAQECEHAEDRTHSQFMAAQGGTHNRYLINASQMADSPV